MPTTDDPSLRRSFTYACPRCGKTTTDAVWLILDGDRRPDLLRKLAAGTLQLVRCPQCGYQAEPDSELLVWRRGTFPHLLYIPSRHGAESLEDAEQEIGRLCEELPKQARDPALSGHLEVCPVTPSAIAEVLERDVAADVLAYERGALDPDASPHYRRVLKLVSRDRNEADRAFAEARAKAEEGSEEWAVATNDLALSLIERQIGDQSHNLETAIELFNDLLRFHSLESDPERWTAIKTHLGIAYRRRLAGNHAENVELAVDSYRAAQAALRCKPYGLDLATLECNLAAALLERALGEKDSNRTEALELLERALPMIEKEGSDVGMGIALLTRGNALLRGAERELEEAEACCRQAIDRFRRAGHPIRAARVVLSLAAVIEQGDEARRPEAIEALQAALIDLPAERAPVDRARVLRSLGRFLLEEAQRNPAGSGFEEGTDCIRRALEVLTPTTDPVEARDAASELGAALAGAGEWEQAAAAFRTALDAAERLYGTAVLGFSRDHELSESGSLHHMAAYALARAGDLDGAVEALELGRARWARAALATANALLALSGRLTPSERKTLEAARRELTEVDSLERAAVFRGPAARGPARAALANRLNTASGEIEVVAARVGLVTRSADAAEIAAGLEPGEGIVFLTATRWGTIVLIVTAEQVAPVWSEAFTSADLGDALEPYLGPLLLDHEELERAIGGLVGAVGPDLLVPLWRALADLGLDRVVFVPAGALGLIPLNVLPEQRPAGAERARRNIEIVHAPSAAARNAARQQAGAPSGHGGFVAVADPLNGGDPLPFAASAAEAVATTFDEGRVLSGFEASKANVVHALEGAAHAHFACHGQYELERPLTSRLELAEGSILTLHELLDKRMFEGVRLVTAFSCNSGLWQLDRATDEVLGFATGFLRAGAAGAIVTSWPVQDLPAALFSTRLYEEILASMTPARALASARAWLAEATNREVADWVTAARVVGPATALWNARARDQPAAMPFAHPLHWAPYMLVGA